MANFTTIENTPVAINILNLARDTGWSLPNEGTAVHTSCNSGKLRYVGGGNPVAGQTYNITYTVQSISGGTVQFFIGTGAGQLITTPGFVQDTIVAAGSDLTPYFFSDANCVLSGGVSLVLVSAPLAQNAKSTMSYSHKLNKWTSFYTYNPDDGFSLFTNTFTHYKGLLYKHDHDGTTRNQFYGTQYQSILQFVEAKDPILIKVYETISYQANMLLVTTQGGITTSLGQKSTLIDTDFVKSTLDDGISQVTIYDKYGVYSASFLNDENDDVVDGTPLRGNYLICALETVDGSTALTLFSVVIKSAYLPIGSR